jgi:hypothetical protein
MTPRKAPRCDGCRRVIRDSHHELSLVDHTTGRTIARYHLICQHDAKEYFLPGAVLQAVYRHPTRCGPDQRDCDRGAFEVVA